MSPEPPDAPEPKTDPEPPEGPGGVDARPDWEAAGPDPTVPDPPVSAQVDEVPEEITTPEDISESEQSSDAAGNTEGTKSDDDEDDGPQIEEPA